MVTTQTEASRLAKIWWESFPDCTNGHHFVALPESFEVPRLGPASKKRCDLVSSAAWETESTRGLGPHLLRFGVSNLALLAAANPSVRERFDRLKIRYGSRTIDTPDLWRSFLAGFKVVGLD